MNVGSFDARNIIPARLASVGYTAAQFAIIVGVNETRFSRKLRGLIALDGDEAQRYLRVTEELQALAAVLEPLRLSENPFITAAMLEDFRAHRDHWEQLQIALTALRGRVGSAIEEDK